MRFGQNVLRMTWKEGFVQFSWKAYCFPVLERIWGQCDDFDNFDPQKCELAKTCCAWHEKRVLYNFHEKRTVFPFWREFETSLTILRSLTLKVRFGPNLPAWPEKSVLYNFHGKRTVFPFWREFEASVTNLRTLMLTNLIWPKRAAHDLKRAFCTIFMKSAPVFQFWREFTASVTILTTLTLTNAIWPKRAAHDLKRAFCTIFMKSALFPRFGENLRPVWRFWQLWPSKMRFSAVFPFSGQLQASLTILRTLTLKNAICPKRAAHDLKRAFCTIFMKSALLSCFGENFRPVWLF